MRSARVAAWLLALAAVGCALVLARIVAGSGTRGLELGRAHVTSIDPELARQLASGDMDLLVQWFGPVASERPAGYDEVEANVRSTFEALERAAPERVHTQILRPDADPEARRYAEALGLAPFRARRIVRDGWTDVPVWSTLRTTVAGRGASVVRALTPELALDTQALVGSGIAEIESPRRPRIALSAPPGHARLRELLRELGDVREIDYDDDAALPDDCDLFCWIAPRDVRSTHVERLRAFVDRGGSAFIAANCFDARVEGTDLVLEATDDASEKLFADLGLAANARPLLEAPSSEAVASAGDWTYHVVRSIGSRQDFRAFVSQPNGTLAFHAPAALSPDTEQLRATATTFTSIATSSDRCFVPPVGARRVPVAQLASGSFGTAEPPRTLMALLRPDDPTRGSVVVSAASSPFDDRGLRDANFAHAELVRVVVRTLASAERRALAAVARARAAPLPPATDAQRWTARALCIALIPLLLLSIGIARGAIVLRDLGGRTFGLAAIAVLGLSLVGIASFALVGHAGIDVARADAHAVSPELASIADAAASAPGGATITAAFSGPSALPADLRPLVRELADRCERLARDVDGLDFESIAPDTGIAAATLGVRPVERTSVLGDTRASQTFFASVVVQRGSERRVLEFADREDFDHAEFRLALALRDATLAARTTVLFASEPARVTPAEAQSLYQRHKLFAPGTGDPFASARALLERNGFDVRSVDPTRADVLPSDAPSLFVWLQPRRDATSGVRFLARHLASGGNALLAAQMHRVRPRLRSERAGDASLWPEPLFPDLDRLWLPEIGVQLAPDLVLDAASGVLRAEGTRERDGRAESVTMDIASPLVVRSTPALRPVTPFTAGVGDLVLPSPARITIDAGQLAQRGLAAVVILATSPRSWTRGWEGGDVPAEAYTAPAADGEPLTLGVAISGAFPGPSADPALAREGDVADPTGHDARLVLLGTSEPFTDANLAVGGDDAARLLLQCCAVLALPPEFATILARRPTVGGYRSLEPETRLRARVATSAAGPILVLVLAGTWQWSRRRRIARETRVEAAA